MKYSLRQSTEADFEFVFKLNQANMRRYVELLRGWDDEAERETMRGRFRPGTDQIITINGQDVGVLAVDWQPESIDLRHIEIMPDYQNRGIGTAIVSDILEQARREGLPITLMVLEMNPAHRLYARLGFKIIETVDTGATGIRYRMRA